VFDYDAHFDAFQDAKKKKTAAADGERIERKARYITALMAKQKEREREEEIIYEAGGCAVESS
jgi:coiled-coil domain-containing protein 55